MLRGIQKNFIQIQIRDSRYFETAVFVLRNDAGGGDSERNKRAAQGGWERNETVRGNEMMKEAHRILAESNLFSSSPKKKKQQKSGRFVSFLYGLLTGASAVALLWLTVLLLA